MAKFKVVLGTDWDLSAKIEGEDAEPVKLINALENFKVFELKLKEVVGRHLLTGAIVLVFALALLAATVWGWQQANFSGLQQVWAAGSVPLGWVAGYYFRKDGSRS